jgi:hypothetical protein
MKRIIFFPALTLLLSFVPCASEQQKSESAASPSLMTPLGFLVVPTGDKDGQVPMRCFGSTEDFSDFGGIEKDCDTIITEWSDEAVPRHADVYNLVFVAASGSLADLQSEKRWRELAESAKRMVIRCRYHGDMEACGPFPPGKRAITVLLDGQSLWVVAPGRRIKYTILKQLPPYKAKKN